MAENRIRFKDGHYPKFEVKAHLQGFLTKISEIEIEHTNEKYIVKSLGPLAFTNLFNLVYLKDRVDRHKEQIDAKYKYWAEKLKKWKIERYCFTSNVEVKHERILENKRDIENKIQSEGYNIEKDPNRNDEIFVPFAMNKTDHRKIWKDRFRPYLTLQDIQLEFDKSLRHTSRNRLNSQDWFNTGRQEFVDKIAINNRKWLFPLVSISSSNQEKSLILIYYYLILRILSFKKFIKF